MAIFPITLFLSYVALFAVSTEATCTCKEVCPTYTDVWLVRSDCPPEGMKRCIHYILVDSRITCLEWERAPEGGCVCNVFGCNCDGCGCGSKRGLRSSGALESFPFVKEEDVCEDYRFYTSMSEDERYAYLADKHCGNSGLSATAPDIRVALERLADANNDGTLSCEEFNTAEFNVQSFGFCRKYN